MRNRHEVNVHNVSSSSKPGAGKSRKTAHRAKLAEQKTQRSTSMVSEAVPEAVPDNTGLSLDQLLASVKDTDFEALLAGSVDPVSKEKSYQTADTIPEPLSYSSAVDGVTFNTADDLEINDHEQHDLLFFEDCPRDLCQTVCVEEERQQQRIETNLKESDEQNILSGMTNEELLALSGETDWDAAIFNMTGWRADD